MKIILLFFYNLFWFFIYILTFPYTLIKRRTSPDEWLERLGAYPFDYSKDGKSLWLHGASLGEITAASRLAMRIREKFPKKKIIISSMTTTGKERAMKTMKGINHFVLIPFDFFPIVANGLTRINPDVLILIETEIWPSLIFISKRWGAKIILANARLSDRTFKRYLLLKSLTQRLFNQIDIFFPKSRGEEKKFLELGVRKSKIKITGCLKSDNSLPEPINRSSLSIPEDKSIIVAGSVRKGEEKVVIKVFKSVKKNFKDLYLVIAPRHLNRVCEIENILNKENLPYRRKTEKLSYNGETVFILDTIGELRKVYSVADIAFVGGTLLPYGGHNLIEPAFFGVPILFGPYVNNTRESAVELTKSGSAIVVKSGEDLKMILSYLLKHPEKRKEMGMNARNYLKQKKGIVDNYIDILEKNGIL